MEDYIATHRTGGSDEPEAAPRQLANLLEAGTSAAEKVSSPWLQVRRQIGPGLRMSAMSRLIDQVPREAEGSDALLFSTVPRWISFKLIPGCRYRMVTGIHDSGDETDSLALGINFLGYPGGSGWANRIGDVAVHYLSAKWVIFSKILPFPEQAEARELHEDVLLLGAATDVWQTTGCALQVGTAGLGDPQTPVRLITSEGVRELTVPAAKLSKHVRWRLYLSWGHESEPYAEEVARFRLTAEELQEPDEAPVRHWLLHRLYVGLLQLNGRLKVDELLERLPIKPVDPTYYRRLLTVSCDQTVDEIDARALSQPRPSARWRREHPEADRGFGASTEGDEAGGAAVEAIAVDVPRGAPSSPPAEKPRLSA